MYSTLIYTHLEKKHNCNASNLFSHWWKSRTINWKMSYLKLNWKDLAIKSEISGCITETGGVMASCSFSKPQRRCHIAHEDTCCLRTSCTWILSTTSMLQLSGKQRKTCHYVVNVASHLGNVALAATKKERYLFTITYTVSNQYTIFTTQASRRSVPVKLHV